MKMGMLVCREVTELVTDYVEGRLSWLDRLRFQLHVGMCRHCREYLRQIKMTQRLLGELPPQPPPPEVEAELVERFKNWKRT
jgi:predicted anti-sigma-YlaC factor YlaD